MPEILTLDVAREKEVPYQASKLLTNYRVVGFQVYRQRVYDPDTGNFVGWTDLGTHFTVTLASDYGDVVNVRIAEGLAAVTAIVSAMNTHDFSTGPSFVKYLLQQVATVSGFAGVVSGTPE